MRRVAVITGASRGLGAALAGGFWADGYSLLLVARNRAGLERVAAGLPHSADQSCHVVSCDLGDPAAVQDLVSETLQRYRRLDVLVNNAAIHGPIGLVRDTDLALWRHTLQVNFMAPVTLCQGVVRTMDDVGGSIVNISGGGATAPRPRFAAYAASKAALVRFSETLAEEVRDRRIRVNCVAPGPMKTRLLDDILRNPQTSGSAEVAKVLALDETPDRSFDRVCRLVLFLASDTAQGITGKLISAQWDRWEDWPSHREELATTDAYTLRRIAGKDRGMPWGDR